VTAREVSLSEIKLMIAHLHNEIEIEIFAHGAVCIAYSGRCMLSSNMCLRDANNGGCAQSCR
jgi:putative protease